MKGFLRILLMAALISTLVAMTGCGGSDNTESSDDSLKAVCSNGVMVGQEENGVASWLGIPYAKPPVGDLRWRAPEPAEDSEEEITCDHFGYTALQYEWPTEPASYEEKSEDCLTLNVWSSTEETDTPKAVMFWIHGGSNSWGGTADPIYNGQHFVEAHPDVVLVTANYRLGMMSWPDFTKVPGGESYKDINLGLRDQICALEWVQKNIASFGGDPENVTIFGESAGSGNVTALMISPLAEGLFNKVIAESGTVLYFAQDTSRKDAQEYASYIMEATGSKTMDDLLALSEEELMKYDTEAWIGDASCGTVADGDVLPLAEDIPAAIENAADRGIIFMNGATADEMNYFMVDSEGETKEEKFASWKAGMDETWKEFGEDEAAKPLLDQFYKLSEALVPEEYAKDAEVKDALTKSRLSTELFREGHVQMSDIFSDAGGKTYMYYWEVPSTLDDYYKSACHAIELSYVFNNTEDTIYSGETDEATAEKTHTAWANFAKTGDPSIEGIVWEEYNSKDKPTMDIALDGWEMKNDPTKDFREIIEQLLGE